MANKNLRYSGFVNDSNFEIIHGQAELELDNLIKQKKGFKLILTSPPYNIGKEYETKISVKDYLKSQTEIIRKLVDLLDENGSICWQVGNYIEKGEVFPLDIFYYDIFKSLGLFLRNRIIWRFGHGLHASKRFSGRYETILWFSKTSNYTFNLDSVRVPSKYPGKRHSKGPNKGLPSSSPLGKNPSDIWDIVVKDWDNEIWDVPNVKANHPEKTEHPCQYPVELVERCILALTNAGDWVLDPFNGVGSTMLAALKNNRNVIGIEKYKKYCDISAQRIVKLQNNNLKTRPITQEIYVPDPKSKVASIPVEWHKK